MKKFLSVLLLILCLSLFTACGEDKDYKATIDSTDVAKLSLFSYDGKSESVWGLANLGHAFLSIENISDSEFYIGQKKVAVGETIAIGTWSILDHFGVWYNVESNYIKEHNKYDGRVSVTIGIDGDDIETLNSEIAKRDKWGVLNNCSRFALSVYNAVANENETIKTPLIYTPSYLTKYIKKFESFEYNKEIITEDTLGYFDNTSYVSFNLEKAKEV